MVNLFIACEETHPRPRKNKKQNLKRIYRFAIILTIIICVLILLFFTVYYYGLKRDLKTSVCFGLFIIYPMNVPINYSY